MRYVCVHGGGVSSRGSKSNRASGLMVGRKIQAVVVVNMHVERHVFRERGLAPVTAMFALVRKARELAQCRVVAAQEQQHTPAVERSVWIRQLQGGIHARVSHVVPLLQILGHEHHHPTQGRHVPESTITNINVHTRKQVYTRSI